MHWYCTSLPVLICQRMYVPPLMISICPYRDIVYNTDAHITIFEKIFSSQIWHQVDIGGPFTQNPGVYYTKCVICE